jgi:hypothetical protein
MMMEISRGATITLVFRGLGWDSPKGRLRGDKKISAHFAKELDE